MAFTVSSAIRCNHLAEWKPQGIVLTVIALPLLLLPMFGTPFVLAVGTQIIIFAIWAYSLDLLVDLSGLVSLGHAAILGVSAYVMILLETRAGISYVVAAAFTLAGTQAVCVVFSALTMRSNGIYFLMITIAEGMVLWGFTISSTALTGGDNGLLGSPAPGILSNASVYYWYCACFLAACILMVYLYRRTNLALQMKGCRESESRMRSLGYNVAVLKVVAFNISGLIAAVAGILYAGFFHFISPSAVSVDQSILVLLIVLIGGAGTLGGPLIGAIVIVGGEQVLLMYTRHWETVMGVLFVAVVLLRTEGVRGAVGRVAHKYFALLTVRAPRVTPRSVRFAAAPPAAGGTSGPEATVDRSSLDTKDTRDLH